MGKIAANITEIIGHTPMLKLGEMSDYPSAKAEVLLKLESFNPAGSAKDRVALSMVEDAEQRGILKKGATIIEPTSGNTGVGLALVCAVKGYKLILTMPDTMSLERRRLLAAYGARIELTPGHGGMEASIERACQLKGEIEGSVILGQFDNPANPLAHYNTTALEIWEDTDGKVDILIAGVGTGGTLSGTGRRLKEFNPDIKLICAEPEHSAVINGGSAGPHKLQGIGAGFVPVNFDGQIVDEVLTVGDGEAMSCTRKLAREKGILVGISSGAALVAALKVASREENIGKRIVVILPDSGERYLSTGIFD